MRTKIYLLLAFLVFSLNENLYAQEYHIEAGILLGNVSFERLNGERTLVINKNALPQVISEINPTYFDKSFTGFQIKGTKKLHNILHVGTHVSYSKHKFGLDYAISNIGNNNYFHANHLLNIKKLGVGIETILMWKYLDLGLLFGISMNSNEFERGFVKSADHFKMNNLEKQSFNMTKNGYFGMNLQAKLPLHKKGLIYGGVQFAEQLKNNVIKNHYQISYTTISFSFGYRHQF
jgi:hypothetical protein